MGIVLHADENNKLDVKKAMAVRPSMWIEIFFDHVIKYCKSGSVEVLCFDQSDHWTFAENFELTEILEEIKDLKIDASYKNRAAENYVYFLKMKKPIQDKFKAHTNTTVNIKIEELYARYPSKHLDWLLMINNQLLQDSQQTLDDEILIHNPQLWDKLHELFMQFDDK